MTKTEKLGVDKIFKALDQNGDGLLDKYDVQKGYQDYFGKYMTDEEVTTIFNRVDIDGGGTIDYSEFLIAAMS